MSRQFPYIHRPQRQRWRTAAKNLFAHFNWGGTGTNAGPSSSIDESSNSIRMLIYSTRSDRQTPLLAVLIVTCTSDETACIRSGGGRWELRCAPIPEQTDSSQIGLGDSINGPVCGRYHSTQDKYALILKKQQLCVRINQLLCRMPFSAHDTTPQLWHQRSTFEPNRNVSITYWKHWQTTKL